MARPMIPAQVDPELRDVIERNLRHAVKPALVDELAGTISMALMRQPEVMVRAIAQSGHQPEHYLEVGADDVWCVQHSLACRLTGRMYARCLIHHEISRLREGGGQWPRPGRYELGVKDGALQLRRVS